MHQIKILLKPIAVTLIVQSIFMLICTFVAIYMGEKSSYIGFAKTIIVIIIISAIMLFIARSAKRKSHLSIRSGLFLVTMIWVFVCFIGALPYHFSGAIPKYADAIFESVSGFTTTGSSILSDIESLPVSILLWRALTHWLGGGGIVVLSVAILPLLGIGGMQMFKAESSGLKGEKLTPRIGKTAKYLWVLYSVLTIIGVILLMAGGMNIFDAFTHASSAISTGGFSNKNSSVAYFDSAYIDWVLICIMFIGGMNFILIIRFATGKFSYIKKNSELKGYIFIIVLTTAVISLSNYLDKLYTLSIFDTIRHATFQVVTMLTTTGFSSDNYLLWPPISQAVIFAIMFIGACSGSTAGGIKIIRYIALAKQSLLEMRYLLHPSAIFTLRLNGQPIKNNISHTIIGLFFLYFSTIFIFTIVVATSGTDLLTSLTAVVASIGNIGPGFGRVGPVDNYGFFPDYIKYVLSFVMILGRLELYTVLILFSVWFWKR